MPFWDRRAARQVGNIAFLTRLLDNCLAEVSSLHKALLKARSRAQFPSAPATDMLSHPYGSTEARSALTSPWASEEATHYITSQVAYHAVGIYERKACKDEGLPPRLSR